MFIERMKQFEVEEDSAGIQICFVFAAISSFYLNSIILKSLINLDGECSVIEGLYLTIYLTLHGICY